VPILPPHNLWEGGLIVRNACDTRQTRYFEYQIFPFLSTIFFICILLGRIDLLFKNIDILELLSKVHMSFK
jgi:hypothetical protein